MPLIAPSTPLNRICVTVTTEDGDFWETAINATIEEARAYFMGVKFGNRKPVVSVELLPLKENP